MAFLHVYVVPDSNFWFAQGVEIDYAAQGDSIDDAVQNFMTGLQRTIELNAMPLPTTPPQTLRETTEGANMIKHSVVAADVGSFHGVQIMVPEVAGPLVGHVYEVSMEDCCIIGSFTSRLVAKTDDSEYTFENGVNLTCSWGCRFAGVDA